MEEELLPKCEFAMIDSVDWVNQQPHPFMIGPQHFPKHGGMYIQPEQAPCAMQGCGLMYDQHTKGDHVAFVKLLRNCTNTEISGWLKTLIADDEGNLNGEWPSSVKEKLDGFAFIDTGFRVT